MSVGWTEPPHPALGGAIVAGGSGFIGRHVCAQLVRDGFSPVVALSRGVVDADTGRAADRRLDGGVLTVHVDCGAAGELHAEALVRRLEALRPVFLVNCVGVKRSTRAQSFRRAHEEVTANLLHLAALLKIHHFVHVSVTAAAPSATSDYHNTKHNAERLLHAAMDKSSRFITILRPGVVFGPGDNMVTNLVRSIRHTAVFPLIGDGSAPLQPVHVLDVAACCARVLRAGAAAAGQTIDCVGGSVFPLRDIVAMAARGMGMPAMVFIEVPIGIHLFLGRMMTRIFTDPITTESQVRMLADGITGDNSFMVRQLDLRPQAFSAEHVRALEKGTGPLFGLSMRLFASRDAFEWLGALPAPPFPLALLAVLVLLLGVGLLSALQLAVLSGAGALLKAAACAWFVFAAVACRLPQGLVGLLCVAQLGTVFFPAAAGAQVAVAVLFLELAFQHALVVPLLQYATGGGAAHSDGMLVALSASVFWTVCVALGTVFVGYAPLGGRVLVALAALRLGAVSAFIRARSAWPVALLLAVCAFAWRLRF